MAPIAIDLCHLQFWSPTRQIDLQLWHDLSYLFRFFSGMEHLLHLDAVMPSSVSSLGRAGTIGSLRRSWTTSCVSSTWTFLSFRCTWFLSTISTCCPGLYLFLLGLGLPPFLYYDIMKEELCVTS